MSKWKKHHDPHSKTPISDVTDFNTAQVHGAFFSNFTLNLLFENVVADQLLCKHGPCDATVMRSRAAIGKSFVFAKLLCDGREFLITHIVAAIVLLGSVVDRQRSLKFSVEVEVLNKQWSHACCADVVHTPE